MKEQIKNVVGRLGVEINKTPTGELRNLLTDANILLQSVYDSTLTSSTPNEELEYCNKHKWSDCECVDACRRGLRINSIN